MRAKQSDLYGKSFKRSSHLSISYSSLRSRSAPQTISFIKVPAGAVQIKDLLFPSSSQRASVVSHDWIPLKASTASALHAPTATARRRDSSIDRPRSSAARKPAIVASPEPVV